jgi:hypothetical protein
MCAQVWRQCVVNRGPAYLMSMKRRRQWSWCANVQTALCSRMAGESITLQVQSCTRVPSW